MSLPKSKRVRHITPAGEEIFEEDEEWRFLQYVAPSQASIATAKPCTHRPVDLTRTRARTLHAC